MEGDQGPKLGLGKHMPYGIQGHQQQVMMMGLVAQAGRLTALSLCPPCCAACLFAGLAGQVRCFIHV